MATIDPALVRERDRPRRLEAARRAAVLRTAAKRTSVGVLTALALFLWADNARADSGTVRFSGQCNGHRVTVFTAPTPPRAGLVDVSVLVQDVASGKALSNVPVSVHAYPIGKPEQRTGGLATADLATNKLFRAAMLELSEPGLWRVEVVVEGEESGSVVFEMEAADALPAWIDLGLWIGWPAAAVGFFGLHQWLVHRRQRAVKIGRIKN